MSDRAVADAAARITLTTMTEILYDDDGTVRCLLVREDVRTILAELQRLRECEAQLKRLEDDGR